MFDRRNLEASRSLLDFPPRKHAFEHLFLGAQERRTCEGKPRGDSARIDSIVHQIPSLHDGIYHQMRELGGSLMWRGSDAFAPALVHAATVGS
ncbi:hypothetical protein RI685_16430 (plasmid) [Clavibacter michiganensis]|uniref:hypothetical protein n=1 Tax=Clavibacter michiganensis TaxID=28447 RepID=UPI003DA05DFA